MTRWSALGLDIGSSRIKAILVDPGGAAIGPALTCPTPFEESAAGLSLRPHRVLEAVARLLERLGDRCRDVAAVGVASMGEAGTVLSGRELVDLPFPAWFDGRGQVESARLREAFGNGLLVRTGRQARAGTTVAKLAWLADDGWEPAGQWLGVAAAVVWALTGRAGQDASLAATTGAFDPFARAFDEDVWRRAGLAAVGLIPPDGATPPARRVSVEGAAWSGLRAGTPAFVAGHDHLVGAIGAGVRPGELADSMGTGEPLLTVWPRELPRPDPTRLVELIEAGITFGCWPGTGDAAVMWEGLLPGRVLATLTRWFGADHDALGARAPAPGVVRPFDRRVLTELAEGEGRSLEGLGAAEAWAGAVDGIAAVFAGAERYLRDATGVSGRTVLFGGGTRSRRMLAAKQRVASGPCWLSAEMEAVARGAAVLGARWAGLWDAADVPAPELTPLAEALGPGAGAGPSPAPGAP